MSVCFGGIFVVVIVVDDDFVDFFLCTWFGFVCVHRYKRKGDVDLTSQASSTERKESAL